MDSDPVFIYAIYPTYSEIYRVSDFLSYNYYFYDLRDTKSKVDNIFYINNTNDASYNS